MSTMPNSEVLVPVLNTSMTVITPVSLNVLMVISSMVNISITALLPQVKGYSDFILNTRLVVRTTKHGGSYNQCYTSIWVQQSSLTMASVSAHKLRYVQN